MKKLKFYALILVTIFLFLSPRAMTMMTSQKENSRKAFLL